MGPPVRGRTRAIAIRALLLTDGQRSLGAIA